MVRAMLLAALSAAVPALVPAVPDPGPSPAAATVAGVPGGTAPTRAPAAGWGWPLAPDPSVVQRFHAPPTPWTTGHRGVDLAAAVGQPVLSAGRGQVSFAGVVAGRGVVVVQHPGGLRTTYEPVADRALVGAFVARGDRIGAVADTAGHCAPETCLHWGLRLGEDYRDPLTLLGHGRPVLLPLAG